MDNTIFDKSWYRKLPVRLKIVWFYLINKCNHAGIWECDLDLLSFQIGEEYTLKEILEAFNGNIVEIEKDKYYLPKFIEFQYGLPLNLKVKVHQSVIKIINKYNKGLANSLLDLQSIKDKDIIKDKGKDIETRKECFAKRVEKEVFDMNLDPQLLKEFIDYWTEHNTNGNTMRYEQQSIFNVKRRVSTWIKNSKAFKSNLTFQPVDEDLEKKEIRIEREYKAQQERFKKEEDDIASDEDRKKALGIK